MSRIIVHQGLLTKENKAQLIALCPFSAFEEISGKLVVNEKCRLCMQCVRKGPKGVCELEQTSVTLDYDTNSWKGIAVFIEQHNQTVEEVSFELLGKARQLAAESNQKVHAFLLCGDQEGILSELEAYDIDEIHVVVDDILTEFDVMRYRNPLIKLINAVRPSTVLFGATAVGRSLAPRIAAYFHTGLTADCTVLDIREDGSLLQTRPAYGGNILATIEIARHRPQMATVRPRVFQHPDKTGFHGQIYRYDGWKIDIDPRIETIEIMRKPPAKDLVDADIIVVCGRPFHTEEQMKTAYLLATKLGGVIGATRPLVEAGLANPRIQVGLSGRTVAPKLIITLGVSGSVQFIAGMKGSKRIIAVNRDPEAAIFDIADIGVVGDVFDILPILLDSIDMYLAKENEHATL